MSVYRNEADRPLIICEPCRGRIHVGRLFRESAVVGSALFQASGSAASSSQSVACLLEAAVGPPAGVPLVHVAGSSSPGVPHCVGCGSPLSPSHDLGAGGSPPPAPPTHI